MTATTPAPSDLAPVGRLLLFEAREEREYDISRYFGARQMAERGVCQRAGAFSERAGRRYRHWLDGDGMVCALKFSEEGCVLRTVSSGHPSGPREAAGEFLYRGVQIIPGRPAAP